MSLEFLGYARSGGGAGTRNAVAVVASVICSTFPVEEIARRVPGTVPVVHPFGCAQVGDDSTQTQRTLAGVAANPNVGAALIVGLGCETNQASVLAERIGAAKPIEILGIQEAGGSDVVVRVGSEIAARFVRDRERETRVRCGAEALTVGILGVDADERTYESVYPAVGWAVDRLVEAGARVILGVTSALAPRADVLAGRAGEPATQERLRGLARGLSRMAWADASAGGAIARPWTHSERERAERELALAGRAAVQDVVSYAERPRRAGLTVMTLPQNPVEALTGLVAAGANVILVASSRALFTGAVAVPTVVVAPRQGGAGALGEFVDHHVESADAALEGDRLLRVLVAIASGEPCTAEREEIAQLAIWQVWTSF